MNWILVFIGGGLGSMARYGISKILTSNFTYVNIYATFVANILATLTLGILMYFFSKELDTNMKLLIATGFCGGFSTFSTFSYETFQLLKMQEYAWAAANVVVSIFVALFVLFLIYKTSNIQ